MAEVSFSYYIFYFVFNECSGHYCPLFSFDNKEVIHVDDEPSLSNHVSEGVIHESLEHGWGVAETKEHNGRFEELSYPQNRIKFNYGSLLSCSPIPEHFRPASS